MFFKKFWPLSKNMKKNARKKKSCQRVNSAQQELDGQVIIVIVDPFMRRVHKMVPQVRIEKC